MKLQVIKNDKQSSNLVKVKVVVVIDSTLKIKYGKYRKTCQ